MESFKRVIFAFGYFFVLVAGTAFLYLLSREAALVFNMVCLGILTSIIARKKNRNFLGWLVIGTFTGILGLAMAIAAKPTVTRNE